MQINNMISSYSGEREKEVRGIFASIFILQNRLQTVFDRADPHITLKQFMLLVMIRHSPEKQTFTYFGELLGSSRQNIKKLALSLEKKGFVIIQPSPTDKRSMTITMTKEAEEYFEKISTLHNLKLENLFNHYSDEEIHLFYSLITRLYNGLDNDEKDKDELTY
ncbi:MAG: MarR family transcriptional regulator [Clostridiaceae bacterium]